MKNSSKQSGDTNKGAIFALVLIPEHSCGIFTALFSHINTTSEREETESFVGILHLLTSSAPAAPSAAEGLSVRGESGGGSLKKKETFATVVLRL